MTRTAFTPTKEQRTLARVLVACGTPQSVICGQIINHQTGNPVDLKTLRKAFRAELDDGKAVANSLVAKSLFRKATGDGSQSVTAAIFWLKTQARWRESVVLAGDPDAPLMAPTIVIGGPSEPGDAVPAV